MDGVERRPIPADGAAVGPGDAGVLLSDAELLLSLAEAAAAQPPCERETAWREVIGRLQQGAAALRTQATVGATFLLEEARGERARIVAEAEVLRAEAAVLRAEIDVLRGERDLCLTLAMEAGSAVSRHLAQWRQLQGAAQRLTPTTNPSAGNGTSGDGGCDAHGAAPLAEPAAVTPDRHLATSAHTPIALAAGIPVARLTLTIATLPGLAPLFDVEQALARLPGVRTCVISSVCRALATVDLVLDPPMAPLVVAAEILGQPACPLLLDDVAAQRISTRFAPCSPHENPSMHHRDTASTED